MGVNLLWRTLRISATKRPGHGAKSRGTQNVLCLRIEGREKVSCCLSKGIVCYKATAVEIAENEATSESEDPTRYVLVSSMYFGCNGAVAALPYKW